MAFINLRNLLDPWSELDRMVGTGRRATPSRGALPLRVTEGPEGVVLEAELPGVDPSTVEVTTVGDSVTIEGERESAPPEESLREHRRERWAGRFSRSLTVPGGFVADGVTAEYRGGVLSLRLPRRQESRPRTVEIQAN